MTLLARKSGNYYWVFLYRLIVVMFLYLLCRFIFYFLNWPLFPGIGFSEWLRILSGGFVFDMSAMLYVNAIFTMLMLLPCRFRNTNRYQAVTKVIFFVVNGIAILLNSIDFIYYRFTLRRTTRSVFGEFSHEVNKTGLARHFLLEYWFVVLIFAGLIVLMIWLYGRVKIRPAANDQKSWVFYTKACLALSVAIILTVGGIRGDFKYSTRPITINNAGEYVKSPHEMYLVLNTPFCMIRTWNVNRLSEIRYFTDEEVEKIYSPVHYPAVDSSKPFKKENVVIIILESFGKEAVGGYNKDLDNGEYQGFTPFLDSLMKVSKIYWNSFASGRRSIDALPSVIAGIPNGQDPFVLTPYSSDSLRSLPQILKEEGYHTSFFHGAPNGSMGFKALVNLLGVEHYYGKDEYNNDKDFDGIWGIWDEPFFQYFSSTLSTFKQPFFSTIFSVSSHDPFKVPPQYKGKFKKGPLPILQCIGYTDNALKKFFEKSRGESWFKNTIFVITADHATVSYHPEYQNSWGDVAIPILLYHPGDTSFRGIDTGVIQQIDVMPTVLSMLQYNKPYVAFGKNVLASNKLNFAVSYGAGYRWIEGDYLLFFDGNKSQSLYNYHTDRLMKDNLVKKEPDLTARLEKDLKAFIQQYNNRLLRDKLTVSSRAGSENRK